MPDYIIRIENLSKQYQIVAPQTRHDTLRDALMAFFRSSLRKFSKSSRGGIENKKSMIWALRDVSIDIQPGDVLGIVGRNGAGKSTLLKILSRITEPTKGRIKIRGRVGSLLEVGTGFHPELSGGENIYLNGAILGMSRAEIKRKYDEIIAFAEIERFIDTPVKRYSSGMYVRLAFAVAAHLEPDIFLVDEVLAVGDAAFQKKCLGKMDDVAKKGRTVLFVSHNMDAIRRLCPTSILVDHGKILHRGPSDEVINRYLSNDISDVQPETWIDIPEVEGDGTKEPHFSGLRYSSKNIEFGGRLYSGGPLEIQLAIKSKRSCSVGSIAVTIYDQFGTKLVNADTISQGRIIHLFQDCNIVTFRIAQLHLNPGTYSLGLWLADPSGDLYHHIRSVVKFEVVSLSSKGLGIKPHNDGLVPCAFEVIDVRHLASTDSVHSHLNLDVR